MKPPDAGEDDGGLATGATASARAGLEATDAAATGSAGQSAPQSSDAAPAAAGQPAVTPAAADANVPTADAGEEDAGSAPLTVAEQCTASWPSLNAGTFFCRLCACGGCAAEVVHCLTTGDARAQMLCRDVLACAIEHHCQDGACYCASSGCGYPGPSGDGPCAAQIEAAAAGTRNHVFALRQTDPPLSGEPFVRAIAAISCLYGTDDAAPGPTQTEMCATSCY